MMAAVGSNSCSSSIRFAASAAERIDTPVALPLCRLRLATRPDRTGSTPTTKTIGIVEVAALDSECRLNPNQTRDPRHCERSLALNPNLAQSRGEIGLTKLNDGRGEETRGDKNEALLVTIVRLAVDSFLRRRQAPGYDQTTLRSP
jgi:hypothetical protein